MGRLRRKRNHHGIRDLKRKFSAKNRTKDLDQIHEDLQPGAVEKLKNQEVDIDLPGLGQFYCVECSRYFVNEKSLSEHTKSKVHKRRLKELKEPVYTQKDAEEAAGLRTDNGQKSKPEDLTV